MLGDWESGATGDDLPDRALVIVPTYNERFNIARLIPAILAQDPSLEMLVVDDGSPDGTGAIVDAIAANNPRVHVIHRAGKLGLGTAYIAGFRWALERKYDIRVRDGRRLLPQSGAAAGVPGGDQGMRTWCSGRATRTATSTS